MMWGHVLPQTGELAQAFGAIIDFKPESRMGPVEKLAAGQVLRELGEAGQSVADAPSILPEQYFLIFKRSGP